MEKQKIIKKIVLPILAVGTIAGGIVYANENWHGMHKVKHSQSSQHDNHNSDTHDSNHSNNATSHTGDMLEGFNHDGTKH